MVFLDNCHINENVMSGGCRIVTELYKQWIKFNDIKIVTTSLGFNAWKKRITDTKDLYSFVALKNDENILISYPKRVLSLLHDNNFWKNIRQYRYLYSSSDFWPDSIPALLAKIKNPQIIWIAGFYLFAPTPWQKDSPYKTTTQRWLLGLMYWLTQLPIYYLVKKYADFVFVTSEPDVKKFITAKRDSSKIIVVQGGVDITESEKYLQSQDIIPIERRKYDACFVGRFHYQKGVLILMDIWKLVCQSKPSAKLAMIGLGPLENDIGNKIKKYGLEHNIDLLGFKDGMEKYEIFKQSKIMVHPATYDSGGMAAAEGMAWGLPGVSFDLEALKTYYPKGMVKTEQENIEQFSKNILKLLNDKDYYDKMSSDAHALIAETWNWDKRADIIYHKVF